MSRKHIYCCHSPNFHINVSMCVCVASSMHVTALARLTTAHSHMRTKLQSADLQLYRESTAFKTVCSYILVYYCNIQKKRQIASGPILVYHAISFINIHF